MSKLISETEALQKLQKNMSINHNEYEENPITMEYIHNHFSDFQSTVANGDEIILLPNNLKYGVLKNSFAQYLKEDKTYTCIARVVCISGALPKITIGSVGGLISQTTNLGSTGSCWISHNSMVVNEAKVMEEALITGNSSIKDNAFVGGNALISGESKIEHFAFITGNARVFNVNIMDRVAVGENATVGFEKPKGVAWDNRIYLEGNLRIGGRTLITPNDNCELRLKGNLFLNTGHEFEA